MSRFPKTVLVDTGFWYALCDDTDSYRTKAEQNADIIDTLNLLMPWPCLYETFNTRFAKNGNAVKRLEALMKQGNVIRISDEPYREDALVIAMREAPARGIALVDMVIRLILDDIGVRKHGILTFNPRDFSDICRKRQLELLPY